jgi:GDP-mannose transporter
VLCPCAEDMSVCTSRGCAHPTWRVQTDPALRSPEFLFIAALSCGIGFSISYAALWFLSTTTPTTYSLVGSLNKIPVAIIGIVAFKAPTTRANVASISVGLLAGVLFVRAKQK